MVKCETIAEVQRQLDHPGSGKRIGFVPTMGALHEGHLTLIKQSLRENDITVCSIFVNPLQFNNADDLKNYPRDLGRDMEMLEKAGCDVLFSPSKDEMYPEVPAEKYDFGNLEKVMEGHYRPGHFNGVATVVNRLFEIVRPQRAYFGNKDFQQVAVVRELVKRTNSSVEIIACPTIRELSGLAISSRNRWLSEEEKRKAANIYHWLREISLLRGKVSLREALHRIEEMIDKSEDFRLEYLEIANPDTLQPLQSWPEEGECVCCIAIYLGNVRLIDNLLF